jgi:hypothetical protein
MLQWERIECAGAMLAVHGAKAPGGWPVYAGSVHNLQGGIAFDQDPEHRWDGASPD